MTTTTELVTVTLIPTNRGWHEYVITTATGYRAVIPKCERDECADGHIQECRRKLDQRKQHQTGGKNSVDAWLRHTKTHCHGWHDGRIKDFADDVAQSILRGARRRMPAAITLVKPRSVGPMSPEKVSAALGITPDEYAAELAKAAS